MPDQPADPIHYDMKIPPEPHPDEEKSTGGSGPNDQARESNSAQPEEEQRSDGDASTHSGRPSKS